MWYVSSLRFGLIHVPNMLFGQGIGATVQQVFFAFAIGTAYYVTRRISGALVVTMLLHAMWDFSTFIQGHSVDGIADTTIPFGAFAMCIAVPITFIAVWRLNHDHGDVVEPGGDQVPPFESAA